MHNRQAFTLLELLLVLALIVGVIAMAMPALRGPMEGIRLRNAADLIRGQWAKARNKAIRSGQTYVFRYESGGTNFWTEPWQSPVDILEASPSQNGTPTGPLISSPRDLTGNEDGRQLPDRVSFVLGQTVEDARSALVQQGQSSLALDPIARPIVFYPDGTASTSRLILTNEREQYVVLDLRGLTAVARVSDLLSEEELPQ